jgi:hypothetical protein
VGETFVGVWARYADSTYVLAGRIRMQYPHGDPRPIQEALDDLRTKAAALERSIGYAADHRPSAVLRLRLVALDSRLLGASAAVIFADQEQDDDRSWWPPLEEAIRAVDEAAAELVQPFTDRPD